jgi:lipopolysaccharide/colanic/teichoic acid biosynthesis glycosyltransferase
VTETWYDSYVKQGETIRVTIPQMVKRILWLALSGVGILVLLGVALFVWLWAKIDRFGQVDRAQARAASSAAIVVDDASNKGKVLTGWPTTGLLRGLP